MISVAEVQAWDATSDATKTALAIAAVTKQIEGKSCLCYSLQYASATERATSRGDEFLVLRRYPLIDVDTVLLDTEELEDWEQYDNGDRWGWLYREGGWPYCAGGVRLTGDSVVAGSAVLSVTYSAGYQFPDQTVPEGVLPVPDDLKMAAIDLVLLRMGKRMTELSGRQAVSQSIGAMRITYSDSKQYNSASKIEAEILAGIIENHRRPQLP